MKKLLLVLSLLTSHAFAACAAGTLAYWDFSDQSLSDDCTGAKSFVNTGGVGFSNMACAAGTTYAPLSFNASSYLKYTDTALTALTTGTVVVEFSTYKISRVANSYPINFQTGASNGQFDCIVIGDNPTDNVTVRSNGVVRLTWADVGALGHCRYYAVVFTSTYTQLWVGTDGATPTLVSGSAGVLDCRLTSTVDNLVLGTTAGFTAYNGSINNLRISSVIPAKFPTTDFVAASTGPRSSHWENMVNPHTSKPMIRGVTQ